MLCSSLITVVFYTVLQVVVIQVEAGCYFPFEHHGTYAVQRSDNEYSEVVIEVNRIMPYGTCHSRMGNNLILRDENGCLRCFHMAIRSVNVLQLYSRELPDKCRLQSNDTLAQCPSVEEIDSPQHLSDGRVHELMMYKVRSDMNMEQVQQVYCPISGHYQFSYHRHENTDTVEECPGETSHLSNCPFGFGLNLHFRGCALRENLNMSFQCLGDWTDLRGNKLMALLDVNAYQDRPRYRCAMYSVDERTGRVQMALSSDSSCHRHLTNASHGFERLQLKPALTAAWPSVVSSASCQLPGWAQGRWGNTRVTGHSIVYQDHRQFSTYTAKCVAAHRHKYVVYTRSQCGEESYRCIWLRQRGVNVLQYQTSISYSSQFSPSLCDDSEFGQDRWTTESRSVGSRPVSCPVSGEYEGVIPDTQSLLCAKLYSDCNNPQIMFFTVTSCENSSEIYEEREYQCLGSWNERGVVYTYTQRRDVLTHECFAGITLEDGRFYIAEAGTGHSCHHSVQPTVSGMLIHKLASCYNKANQISSSARPPVPPSNWPSRHVLTSRSHPATRRPAVIRTGSHPTAEKKIPSHSWTTRAPATTTPPWRPITARPRPHIGSASSLSSTHHLLFLATALFLLNW